ncbi:MAG TPA: hypothetical protein VGP33_00325 [Chloroflexota bacterium]|jgi:CheY-like chemotaxis protein|nr:hypothetical protein [Chloroflexota bacterium]
MAVVRRLVSFDVPDGPISSYDAADGLAALRRLAGVQSVDLYETRDGKPEYLLDVQMEQAAAVEVDRELDRQMGEYADYLTNVVRRQFRPVA